LKNYRKASHAVIALMLGLLLVISGCGGSKAEKESVAQAKKVTVDLYLDKTDWAPKLDAVGKLAATNYGNGFKSVPFADTTSYQTTIKQSLSGNNPPDLMTWWSGFRMEELVKSGAVADLTDEWKTYEDQGLNADLAKAFMFDGKIYGAPLNVAYWNVFYNKKVFDANGLTPPTTWDEFMHILEVLKSKNITALANPFEGRWPSFIWFEEFLVHSDPDLYEKLVVGKASYTDPGVVKAMELWKSLIDGGYFGKPGDMSKDILPEFVQGKTAMFLVGQWFSSSFITSGLKPGEDYDAFILPPINEGAGKVAIYETGPIMVSEKGTKKENALAALRNFFKKDTQQLWSESMGFPPLLPGVESKNAVTDKVFNEISTGGYRLIQRYWEATPPDISEFAVDQLGKFILQPDKYMDVLQTIEKHAKDYWASKK
jgi:multiple sugar transport system substrate-binding protein